MSRVVLSLILFLFSTCGLAGDEATKGLSSERRWQIAASHAAHISRWVNKMWLLEALRVANKKGFDESSIVRIEQSWNAVAFTRLAKDIISSRVSTYLKSNVEKSSIYVEAILCDRYGRVIGMYPKTSDYWQGDEAKFLESYNEGRGRVYFSPASYDHSSAAFSMQISVPVQYWNETLGVLIVGIRQH